MARQVFTNNAAGTLLAAIGAGDTALTLNAAEGAAFPALAGGDWFVATLIRDTGELEIIKVTARAGDTFSTIVRAQEGTIALSFDIDERVELRPTAAAFNFLYSELDDINAELAAHDVRLDALEAYDTAAEIRLDALEAYDATVETRLDALEADPAGPTVGTPQSSGSGTSFDFTGIPPGTTSIVITYEDVSTDGVSEIIVQLGDAGGVEATGYLAGAGGVTFSAFAGSLQHTTGFPLISDIQAASCEWSGSITLTLLDAATFTWVCQGTANDPINQFTQFSAGAKSLSAMLDRIRITTSGADNFDGGKLNIAYG